MTERSPREWLVQPGAFGRIAMADVRACDGAFESADRRAAQLQNELVAGLRDRMRGPRKQLTFRDIAAHPLFPYSYDTLSKCTRGQQWMSLRVYAAVQNVLDRLNSA